jgi:RNA polymerase sigma-70 factor (ECF subfamily)
MSQPQHESPTPTLLVRQALELYESSLIAYATSILSGDEDRARDVVQDTLLKLYLADPARVSENLRAWLYAVCRNRAFDVLRKENRMVYAEDETLEWLDESSSHEPPAEDHSELLEQVWNVMDQLPPKQREVVRLKFQHDLSYKDIAAVTGNSVTNVGFLLHTAIKRLRRILHHMVPERT